MSALTKLYRGETRLDFIGTRRRWYLASGVLLLICVLSFIIRGFNYGIEFKGGVQFRIQTSGTSLTVSKVDDAFKGAGTTPPEASQVVGSGSSQTIVVKTGELAPAAQETLQAKVAKALAISPKKINADSVSSSWGHDITVKAIEGLIVFLIVVSIYISLRFQWRMAVGGILALFHDLILAAGVYSLVGFEVTPSTVVGLLTILGFSLYDTVVVYDKVAENSKDILAGSRTTFSEAANLAVNQTLMRSINTSLIALLPVAGLLFVGAGVLGVGTIKDLALILFVGLASGAYSSLFLATPIVVDLTEREPQYKALDQAGRRQAFQRGPQGRRGRAVRRRPPAARPAVRAARPRPRRWAHARSAGADERPASSAPRTARRSRLPVAGDDVQGHRAAARRRRGLRRGDPRAGDRRAGRGRHRRRHRGAGLPARRRPRPPARLRGGAGAQGRQAAAADLAPGLRPRVRQRRDRGAGRRAVRQAGAGRRRRPGHRRHPAGGRANSSPRPGRRSSGWP